MLIKILNRHGGVVVERPFRLREVVGSILGWVILKTLKMVVMAAFLGTQGCGVSITTDCLVSGYLNGPVVLGSCIQYKTINQSIIWILKGNNASVLACIIPVDTNIA